MRLKPIIFFPVVGSGGVLVYREVTRVGDPGVVNIGQQAPDFTVKGEDGRPDQTKRLSGQAGLSEFLGDLVSSVCRRDAGNGDVEKHVQRPEIPDARRKRRYRLGCR